MNKFMPLIAIITTLDPAASLCNAATLNTTSAAVNDGILQNFSSIDWNANGAAWVRGFDLTSSSGLGASDSFTLYYQAFAGSIGTTTPTPNLYVASPGPATGGYELTTFYTLQETATCLTANCDTINIVTNSGNWDIFFDNTPDANQAAGTGFRDGNGNPILSGTWDAGNSIFSSNGAPIGPGAFGSGTANLVGTVTFTDNAFINPDFIDTDFQASLLFPGQSSPTYTRPAAFDGIGATGSNTNTDFVLQADGSQAFTVPEPGTLMLLGAGMLGFGFRKKMN